MKPAIRFFLLMLLGGLFAINGCAPTKVDVTQESVKDLPQPAKYLVYNFSASPDEVKLDDRLSEKVKALVEKSQTSRADQELQVGHAVADALAKKLVEKLRKLGYPAERASTLPSGGENLVLIEGQIVSIDEGSRAERVIIGLGAGRTDVKTMTQVYEYSPTGRSLIIEFDTDAKSGFKPGMAETEGAAALAGHWAMGRAGGTGLAVAGEKFGANVEADADRTADEMAKKLNDFFMSKGWIPTIPQ